MGEIEGRVTIWVVVSGFVLMAITGIVYTWGEVEQARAKCHPAASSSAR